jgi:hypothetical protein
VIERISLDQSGQFYCKLKFLWTAVWEAIFICVRNVFERALSRDSDVGHYAIIRTLLDSVCDIRWEPGLPCQ